MILRTLNYGNCGIFLTMGDAGFSIINRSLLFSQNFLPSCWILEGPIRKLRPEPQKVGTYHDLPSPLFRVYVSGFRVWGAERREPHH